jgi:hypothetical protein
MPRLCLLFTGSVFLLLVGLGSWPESTYAEPTAPLLTFQIANRSPAVIEYTLGERTLPLPPRSTRTHQWCRPVEVTLHWPGVQEQTTVQPHNGAQYTIIREDSGAFSIQ